MIGRRLHYAWVTLAGTCVMMAVGFGMALNSMGVFFPYVCEYFHIGTGEIASYMTLQGVVMTLSMAAVGRIMPRCSYNRLLLAAALVLSGGYFLMARFTALWQWYLMALPTGVAIAFIAPAPISIVISNWFEHRRGFAAGIAFAFSGIAGAILVPTCNEIIRSFGWRAGYRYYGIVAAALLIPTALFLVRQTPEELGLLPYGAQSAGPRRAVQRVAPYGLTLRQALRRPSFYLVLAVAVTLTWAGSMNPQFPTHASVLGLGARTGSLMSSLCLAMQLVFNVPLGSLIDRRGVGLAVTVYSAVAAVGSALLSAATGRALLYAGAMLYGLGMCQTMVVSSLLTRAIFGRRDYGRIQSVVMMAFGLSGALGYMVNGFLRDWTGTYRLSFFLTAACNLTAIACCLLALRLERSQIAANRAMEGQLEAAAGCAE